MKRRFLSLLTAASMLAALLGVTPAVLADNSFVSAKEIKLGDYVQVGQWNGTPILWRCVGFEKITGTDDNGAPVVDSTQTAGEYQEGYLPLMFVVDPLPRSDQEFDSAGQAVAGSHGRGSKDPAAANGGYYRKTEGSNYWPDSNIRDWLTSAAAAGEVEWSCGNAPTYKNDPGFLSQFSTLEKKAIQRVVLPSVLDQFDQELSDNGGTEVYRIPVLKSTSTTTNCDDLQDGREAVLPPGRFYSQTLEETVFLLDIQQYWNLYQNRGVLGDAVLLPGNRPYSLRTPCLRSDQSYSNGQGLLNAGGSFVQHRDSVTRARVPRAVCPAFYLNIDGFLAGGNGSKESPYVPSLGDHTHSLFYCPATAPTCTQKGMGEYWSCSCGLMFADEAGTTEIMAPEAIPATGHSWGPWEVDKAPTLTEKGKLGRGCLSDPTHRESGEDIPPLNDTQVWTREILRPATTKAAGLEKYTSSFGTVERVIPKLGPEGEAVLKLGDYVRLGRWNGEPILWRCVGFEKITGTDTDGNFITDPAQTVRAYQDGYLPLLLADAALCAKQFDCYGSDTTGSHGRNLDDRKWASTGGSSFWADSNLRDWLNSDKGRGEVVYTCGNPPTDASGSPGFLREFSDLEKTAVLPVTQRCIVSPADQTEADAGSGAFSPSQNNCAISEILDGNEEAYHEAWSMQVTDRVFCPDLRQIGNVYANRDALGEQFHFGGRVDTIYFGYWLRTPVGDTRPLQVTDTGMIYASPADNKAGARPALYLSADACVGQGDGTKGTPFQITQDGPAVKDKVGISGAQEPPAPTVEIKPGTPDVEVQGLEELVAALFENGGSGEVTLTVQQLSPEQAAAEAAAIRVLSGERELSFLDISILHGQEPLHELDRTLQFIIPYDTANKKDIRLYRYHEGQAREIGGDPAQGEYFTVEEGKIILHANKFSVYTVGYTPVTEEPPATDDDDPSGGNGSQGGGGTSGDSTGGSGAQGGGSSSGGSGSQGGGSSSGGSSSGSGSRVSINTASLVKGNLSSGEVPVGALLTLKTQNSGISIRYTTDGTEPTLRSVVYGKPIPIEKDMTVKVAAVRGGVLGSVVTYTYTVAAPETASRPGTFRADASSLRYIRGYGDDSFRPDQAATRYEVVEALTNLVNLKEGSEPHPFLDVDPSYADAVSKLVRSGLIKGMTPDTFQGEGPMTRCQLCKVLVLSLELTPGSVETGFSDTTGHWAAPYISALTQAGYIKGYTDGTFRPDLPVTRAELVALLNRVVGRNNVAGTAPSFRDVSEDFWGYEDIQSAALGT